ncbi:HNH endonuclease [Neisseria montereyensis]|uniref:HNH endonuclease n=1 Tax=Neisseria montereyensis TaxID=2973938 RepID=A0ABT2FCS6_9NEIS|nr:HNH endonuclease [Neisseria montereyensis]MCS4534012.1 HNH endonuclease [Neisseria montereyensis]
MAKKDEEVQQKEQMIEPLISVLHKFNGVAKLQYIEKALKELPAEEYPEVFEIAKNYKKKGSYNAFVGDVLEAYSSDSSDFDGTKPDLFRSVYGMASRKGIWALREIPKDIVSSKLSEERLLEQETDVLCEVKVRLEQGKFRTALLNKYKACPLTGINIPSFLIASHIKPWAKSKVREKLDINNGILLAVHLDKLFDVGDISFDNDGLLICQSDEIENLLTEHFKIKTNQLELNNQMRTYLEWHRKYFGFDKNKDKSQNKQYIYFQLK